MQPLVLTGAARLVFRKLYSQNVDLSAMSYARREVPGTRRLRAMTGMGIDLPARLFVVWDSGLWTGSRLVWTKLQTNQPLTAHR